MSSELSPRDRLEEIEDRKIEILLEIGTTNREYSETISRLETEYEGLDAEHYRLKLEVIRRRDKG